jgi:alpha-glucoside transport system substrate-binding protein
MCVMTSAKYETRRASSSEVAPSTIRVVAAAVAAALLAACTGSTPTAEPTATASASSGPVPSAVTSSAIASADGVSVVGLWSGPELESFEAVAARWEADHGATVTWQGTRDVAEAVADGRASDDLPDIAILPNPGLLRELARDGYLVPLDDVLDPDELTTDYGDTWLELGALDGVRYGVPFKINDKSTVWYDPHEFADHGYAVPSTFDELTSLADRIVGDGDTPFSLVAPASPAAGWALTDVVSQLVLTGCGTNLYDGWIAGEVAWTDPCIEGAFDRFDAIVQHDGYVLGGMDGIRDTTDAAGSYPMYTDPPTAYMYPMSSFAKAFITDRFPELTPGTDYATFPFPPVDRGLTGTDMVGGDLVVMIDDTPAARSFLEYLAGPAAQQTWIELGGFTSVNRRVPLDTYSDPVERAIAARLVDATAVRFSAGDLMPFELQRAWWQTMLDLLEHPDRRRELLAGLDEMAAGTQSQPG